MDALIEGDVQMIAPSTSKLTSLIPEWQVVDLPFAFESVNEVSDYLLSPPGIVLEKKMGEKGMYPLAFWDNGFKQMTNNKRPLKRPEDFNDLDFRVMSSEMLVKQFKLLNADAQIEPFDQVFMKLDKNKLNAQENTFSNIVNKNIQHAQDYLTISNHGYLGYLVLMNDAFWHSLPDDIQVIILETLTETSEWEMEIAEEINEESLKILEECECIEIHDMTEDEQKEWEDAFDPLYEEFKERHGAQYIDYLPKHQNNLLYEEEKK